MLHSRSCPSWMCCVARSESVAYGSESVADGSKSVAYGSESMP